MKNLLVCLMLLACLHLRADEVVDVNPPKSVCATISKITLAGGAQYDLTTRAWEVVVEIEIRPPAIPSVPGIAMDPLPNMTSRAVVKVARAEIEAAAGKQALTEVELSVAVRAVVMSKLQALLSGMGA